LNITTVINYLNKERGYNISADYYDNIITWRDWWKGYHEPFHSFKEIGGDGTIIDRKLFTLKMAKKVCEDWASILLNEKTEIVIDDENSSRFILGKEGETGGVLNDNLFWTKANELVEKAFYSGTGAFVLRFNKVKLLGNKVVGDGNSRIRMEYLPAINIIPLTVKQGQIIDVAFVSEVLNRGEKFIYVETHLLESDGYVITNQYFKEDASGESLTKCQLPVGMLESFKTKDDIPLFSIIRPNIVNNIDEYIGLGISVYANATDNLEGVDLAYNNFNRDFKLGGKKVFMNESLTQRDADGKVIAPDDVAQQLFVQFGDEFIDKDGKNNLIHEFNPSLRVAENKDGIQGQLDYLSFKCGLGTKHYQFNAGNIVTATQYMGDKQELIQNASKHYINIKDALKSLVRSILWVGKTILNQPVNPDALVTITFDDSYVIDKESERIRDQQEVRDGLKQKWEYRVKWYGENAEAAKKMVLEQSNDDLMGFGGGK